MNKEISRREFLKLFGAAGAGASLGFVLGRYSRLLDLQTSAVPPTATSMPTRPAEATRTLLQATDSPRAVITPDAQAFDNFLPTNTDSLGGTSYREFLGNSDRLVDAWTVDRSIYSPWYRVETLESVRLAPSAFLPRWSEFEQRSLGLLDTPGVVRDYGRDSTAFILDSGGAHSLAMGYELAKDGGWQPVPMLRGIPCKFDNCATSGADQDVAVALYPATEMLAITRSLPTNSPPAFIWDAHRDGLAMGNAVDNGYRFRLSDMPDSNFLTQQGIMNIIYVNEANKPIIEPIDEQWLNRGKGYNLDWSEILASYQRGGLNIYHLGISPTR